MTGASVAAAVLIIAEYQYKAAFVVDQEINLLACLTQLMLECEFKWEETLPRRSGIPKLNMVDNMK